MFLGSERSVLFCDTTIHHNVRFIFLKDVKHLVSLQMQITAFSVTITYVYGGNCVSFSISSHTITSL